MEYHKDLFWVLFSSSYLSRICHFILQSRGEVPSTTPAPPLPYPCTTVRVWLCVYARRFSACLIHNMQSYVCVDLPMYWSQILSYHHAHDRVALLLSGPKASLLRAKGNKNKQPNRSFFVLINNRSIMFFTFVFLCLSNFVSFVFCFYSSDCFFFLEFF